MRLSKEISDWLKSYSEKNGNMIFVVGVSGGIDSALVSTLCAMTGIETITVSLPIHQEESQIKRARIHMEWLKSNFKNTESIELDLTSTFEEFKYKMNNFDSELGFANSRSRLRMVTLYQIASSRGGLVVGTGNKIEDFGVGFFTKYGDGGVDISPIADLTKTEVRKLAIECGVDQSILDAKPTDGLWEDERTDEEQLGATYEDLEWAMEYIEGKYRYRLDEQKENILKIYSEFNRRNIHKMIPIPVFKKNKDNKCT